MKVYDRFLETSEKVEDFMMDSLLGGLAVILAMTLSITAIAFGLLWIFSDKTDRGECLQYRTDTYVTYNSVNNTIMPRTNYRNVCDVWEYPKGQ